MNYVLKSVSFLVLLIAIVLFAATPALAHCDTMDGPVVKTEEQALAKRNVNLVLIWVQAKDEAEIKQVFNEVLAVRKLNRQAQRLADKYFFETLVRIHRLGEGEPYTGLKPAGTPVEPAIREADEALERASVDSLARELAMKGGTGVRRWGATGFRDLCVLYSEPRSGEESSETRGRGMQRANHVGLLCAASQEILRCAQDELLGHRQR